MLKNAVIRAESVELAIQKGLDQLGITQDQAEIRVISEGKKGFLGFGKQEAVVSITSQSDLSMKEMTRELEKETGRQASSFETVSVKKPSKTADYIKQNNQQREEVAVSLEESDEPVKQPVTSKLEDAPQDQASHPVVEPIDSTDNQEEVLSAVNSKEVVASKDAEEPLPSSEDELGESTIQPSPEVEEQVASAVEDYPEFDEVCAYLEAVVCEYGAESKVHYVASDNQVIFNIETDKSGLVIGKHGRIINSLQILVQTLIHRRNRRRLSVLLNVGDYRDRRLNVLEQMAQRTAEEVLRTKQTMILDPLPAYERKQIHAYLSKVDHISTHSEGKDPNRYLVVDYEA
ncbi:RNA-binding cell elongation regulator Jag/EloR [Facklamia languida]